MNHSDEVQNSTLSLALTKSGCMLAFFILVAVVGSLPLRLKAFKTNKKLLSYTSSFAGGLFLSVGLLHLLPEAVECFESYFSDKEVEAFPFAYLIVILSFSLILLIEKVVTDVPHDHKVHEINKSIEHKLVKKYDFDDDDDIDDFKFHQKAQCIVAQKASFVSTDEVELNPWAPYVLQIGIGIHAVFEGLSIGIQEDIEICIGVALAVACHKWAEGLTLGLAFKQAKVNLQMSTYMILIQAIMNPIGIGIGWLLSEQGPLLVGIFVSISVGTFLYISTVEIIVEEFNVARYKWQKFFIFLIAIGFVSSFWFLEQLTGHEH